MSKMLAILKGKLFIQGVGLVVLFLFIWFMGPEVAISGNYLLESVASRLLTIVLIAGGWIGFRVWQKLANKKNNNAMIEQLSMPENENIDAETGEISRNFDEALKILGSNVRGRKDTAYLYELPWYIIIGPPGSGKTTALVNSGLHFPLEGRFGTEALKGIGGTRHCDWWFTNEAVLIDTAGRFTTQDSHESVDKAAWGKFMGLLKLYRKQQPINGAIIAVSLTEIVGLSDHERANYSHIIRSRIDELIKNLGIRFPVYLMFTKCDLVSGFSEFFAHINADERAQVWGETFNLSSNQDPQADIDSFEKSFEQLIFRLQGQVLCRLNQELDTSKRPAVLGFPSQMATLKLPLVQFLQEVFSHNRFQNSALLRGVYFTSGTQEGRPMDRLLGNMAANFGISPTDVFGSNGKGKSYFLKDLLQRVIFTEAGLAGTDQAVINRRRLMQTAGFSLASLALLLTTSFWFISYNNNKDYIEQIGRLVDKGNENVLSGSITGVDFKAILPELNAMQRASQVFESSTFLYHGGLYQGDSLERRSHTAYLTLLENKLLPMICARLQEIIIRLTNQKDTILTYEALKAYLMYTRLNEQAGIEFDTSMLRELSLDDWQYIYASEPEVVAALQSHHSYLLEHSSLPMKRDKKGKEIISAARDLLKNLSLSEQVYLSIKQELLQDDSKDLIFEDIVGDSGAAVFTARGEIPLSHIRIPHMFTKTGFYKDFLIKYQPRSDDYLANNWVLGQHNSRNSTIHPNELKRQVLEHYYADYISVWRKMLADLRLKTVTEVEQGVLVIETAMSSNGPLETVVNTVALNTNLSQPLSNSDTLQAASDSLAPISGEAQRIVSKVNRVVRSTNKAGLLESLGKPVTEKFSAYHKMVKDNQRETPLTALMDEGRRFSTHLRQTLLEGYSEQVALEAVKKRIEQTGNDRFGNLNSRAVGKPTEVQAWVSTIDEMGWSLMLTKAKDELNQLWKEEVFDFYKYAVEGRYPIDPNSSSELELRDFAEFFRPQGRVDQFIKTHIEPFIKTNNSQWRLKTVYGQQLHLTNRTISQLYNSQQVTRLFFARNSYEPKITFVIKPITIDADLKKFRLKLGEQIFEYAHGPLRSVEMTWPFDGGQDESIFQFWPTNGGLLSESTAGPWSLFKLLEMATLNVTQEHSLYRVTFKKEEFNAQLELRADTVFNPLGSKMLQNFSLPKEL